MAFARTAAVAGAGTVSCAGTTAVTGSGTAFAFAIGGAPSTAQPRVGGTITVGGGSIDRNRAKRIGTFPDLPRLRTRKKRDEELLIFL
jgi:hypothetical protein